MPAVEQILDGGFTMTGTTLVETVTLATAVNNIDDAFIMYSAWGGGGADRPNRTFCRAKFNSTSEIQFTRDDDGYDARIEWCVVELKAGEITNKFTGAINMDAATEDITLAGAGVDRDRTLIIWSHTTSQASSPNASTTPRAELTSDTNLRFTTHSTPSLDQVHVEYQVIEFKAAVVESVNYGSFPDIGASTDEVEVTFGTAVDRDKTLIYHSWRTSSGGTFWARSKVRCFFGSDTVLKARRNQTGGATITVRPNYIALEFNDGTNVQTRSPTMNDATTQVDQAFDAFDQETSCPWIPTSFQNAEQEEDSSMNHRYSLCTQVEQPATNNVRLERESAGPAGTTLTIEQFLVEWDTGAPPPSFQPAWALQGQQHGSGSWEN